MENGQKTLEDLLNTGESFNYLNFASRGEYGYPKAYLPDYNSWIAKVESVIIYVFGKSSPIHEMFKRNESFRPLGNDSDQFENQHNAIMGALKAGIGLVSFVPQEEAEDKFKGNNKVFIVHGHDERLKDQTSIFLSELGLEPIVLHRQADEGLTIIEKFEKYSDVGFAFILLTPDDIGYPVKEEEKSEADRLKEHRARQNVIFEFGYFIGKLGRRRVCCLYKEGVTLPNDVSGYLYKKVNNNIEEVAYTIVKDLKAVGVEVSI
ncbi:nucleotide-binding protein [Neobacillus sp. DY30]|uniref:nucleotide-binding protein n=1 Tax=Neobacillus sp. DY30 TaxID=3047871 RepID=UPI0024BF6651|nr:nucleotide-binding protein [Neobacillus sp. DY30]WHY03394.1 nucleotide-binding protein [Neobacillus sp. DY30]